ncbi:YbcC family protein [Falsiroseomonas sp. HC035]|uniref:YbcC family protein n=1 Tax=Falsiroseomonas sp. HC035 TaxID=3390999 RepID=UPI003D31ECA2
MPFDTSAAPISRPALAAALDRAQRAIPPAWPLAATVAVNPFLGQAEEGLATTAARLRRVAGLPVTMPRAWYAGRVAAGTITEDDLAAALSAAAAPHRPDGIAALRAALDKPAPPPSALPTIADLVAEATGTDWPGIIAERLGAFAAAWFDEGQALWPAPNRGSPYASWRAAALRDLTPEILGLPGFCAHVAAAPPEAEAAATRALSALGAPDAALETLLHRLLMTLGGWAQLARQRGFVADLASGTDPTLAELLAIRLVWEEALLARHAELVGARWKAVLAAHAEPVAATPDDAIDAILQDAADRAAQRTLLATLRPAAAETGSARPALQIAFCIDVRSEVLRRALESLDPGIRTKGFAGFFGLPLAHRPFASDVVENRLPVLLRPSLLTCSAASPGEDADRARIGARARRAWGRFSQAAVSSFAFVESAGPLHGWRLLRDSLSLGRASAKPEPAPRPVVAMAASDRIATAEAVLKAMSPTTDFAPLVLLAGHGASVVNNPHASTLQCGACGGHQGDVSARLLASLLNDPAVREGLAARGVTVPQDTLFLGALHDTTSDAVTIFEDDHPSAPHVAALRQAEAWLTAAGALARAERALRLPRAASAAAVVQRSRDWSETRAEWALAGCRAFIAAPRAATRGRDLAGTAFLHDYDWKLDEGFGVLELILTAPVVVASWISLQYYGSVVAPEAFGGGNKLLHNVTGGVGVVEGNGGALRTGLPWQSVHDGERLAHEPLRLSVVLAAPQEATDAILRRHPQAQALFDNRWLHLFAIDDQGTVSRRRGDGAWRAEAPGALA